LEGRADLGGVFAAAFIVFRWVERPAQAMLRPTHVDRALAAALRLESHGLRGVVIVAESQIGVWGRMEIVPAPGRPG